VLRLLSAREPFPPVEDALKDPNGLLAASDTLDAERLIEAYRQGIFPWYSPGQPVLWWSPDPRMVLEPQAFTLHKSLLKVLRNKTYEVRCDSAFADVMRACAATPRDGQHGTWITEEVIESYCALHARGLAHSVETWIDGELVGGLYGVALGRMFYGESMFAHVTDASKVAFAHLIFFLQKNGCGMIDCQMKTDHLQSLGACEIPRSAFLRRLRTLIDQPTMTGWRELKRAWSSEEVASTRGGTA
jgi:leucyl/phenylalanyl-tRNA---protein transferase